MKKPKLRRGLTALTAALVLGTCAPYPAVQGAAAAKDISDTMTWDALRIGGGGFVSGIVTGKKVMYARTDVGGAYKFNYSTDRWEQLFGFISEADKGMLSVDSMCVDPTDDNTVYFLCGCAYFSDARTAVYKTTDGGKTFSVTDITDLIQVHGNGYGRQFGEAIAVDPDNPKRIYCGGDVASGSSALIVSEDAGKTWKPVKGYDDLGYYTYTVKWPHWTNHTVRACSTANEEAYNEQNGVSTVAVTGGKVYVGTAVKGQTNLVCAEIGSDKFVPADKNLPTDVYPSRINFDADGNLLITYAAGLLFNNGAGGIYRLDPASGKAENISPVENSFGGCISDPKDAKKLYATTCGVWSFQNWDKDTACFGEWMYRSTNGGATWESVYAGKKDGIWVYDEELGDMTDHVLFQYMKTGGHDWIYGKAIHWSGSIMMDPTNPDRIYVVSGNGVFRWDDIWGKGYDEGPVATFHPDGIEEVVSLDFTSTPDGLDLSAIGDYDGFIHESPDKIGIQYQPNMGSTSAIAVCPQNTDVWVRIAEGDTNNTASAYYTTDRGKTWTGMTPAFKGGKAAIAQLENRKYRIFNSAKESGDVSYSDDFGKTWTKCEGIPSQYGSKPTMLLVEPENPEIVYAYATYFNSSWHYSKDEPDASDAQYKFCVSVNGGMTFQSTDICMYDQCDSAGRIGYLGENQLMVAGGWYGMYTVDVDYTTAGLRCLVSQRNVYYCKTLGYGAPEKKGGLNTIYFYGKPEESDPEGIYRSTDGGNTWVCINKDHLYGGTGNGNYLVGDMNEFGKVYMSTVGCGIICGQLSSGSGAQSGTTQTETTASGSEQLPGTVWGDVDCDGTVAIADCIMLARYLAEDAVPVTVQGLTNARVTGKETLTVEDNAKILSYLAGILTKEQLAPSPG